jgi:hypothetical protein
VNECKPLAPGVGVQPAAVRGGDGGARQAVGVAFLTFYSSSSTLRNLRAWVPLRNASGLESTSNGLGTNDAENAGWTKRLTELYLRAQIKYL